MGNRSSKRRVHGDRRRRPSIVQRELVEYVDGLPAGRSITILAIRRHISAPMDQIVECATGASQAGLIGLDAIGGAARWRLYSKKTAAVVEAVKPLTAPVKATVAKPKMAPRVRAPKPAELSDDWFPGTATLPCVMLRTVTPERALSILELSEKSFRNRSVSQTLVAEYSHAIRRGDWKPTGDTIKLDRDRICYDGQHRLWAVVDAAVPIEQFILFNGDRTHVPFIDQGRNRRPGDVLGMQSVVNATACATLAKLDWRYRNGVLDKRVRPTTAETVQHFEAHRDAMQAANRFWNKARAIPGAIGSHFALLALHCGDLDALEAFVDAVRLGSGRNDGADALRRRLFNRLSTRASAGSGSANDWLNILACTIKGWNAWAAAQTIRVLVWRPGANEPFPVISVFVPGAWKNA